MDWKKFFDFEPDGDKEKKANEKFNFKKFDDEDEDDWFDLDTFFNEFEDSRFHAFPKSMLKQFKEVIEAMKEIEENQDPSTKERRLQKFYDNYSDFKQKSDQDLDGKIYANQLDAILKKINPEVMLKDNRDDVKIKKQQPMRKLTDEEKIMDIIHGTYKEEIVPVKPRTKRHVHKAPFSPHHFNAMPPFHEFPPPPSNATKSWGRTIISIRNPDGSYETRKIEKTPDGNTKTTIMKKDAEGHSSTQSFIGDESKAANQMIVDQTKVSQNSTDHYERNLINYDGYKIPCLW
ncbi:hypothetical protein PVAND_006098 [Polypedilum vanderplanki]|uniref:Uncharacterized protein n=1 Tax=Polypedilum vanderplanki TaxID=319348 RepID=A0A9J6C233_POLVA|nr:hypothetical protein PVAND_006098 [Polypedilum vanderplanki]